MPAIHVTGVSGSGESTVASRLSSCGHFAVDADGDPRLAMWVGSDRKPVKEPVRRDGWMDRYWWVWNPKRLDELIADAAPATVFICGNAANENSLRNRFEKQLLLVVDEATAIARLHDTTRDNDYGRARDEVDMLRGFRAGYQQRKLARGAIPIDATRPRDEVVDAILAAAST